jgi:phosphoadenosine phosphosulfate reductase
VELVDRLLDTDLRVSVDATEIETPVSSNRNDALAARLQSEFPDLHPIDRLRLLRRSIAGSLVFTTSLGLEDQALTHLAVNSGIDIKFVTLDTGRLFPETYELWAATERRYKIRIRSYNPDATAVEHFVESEGIDGFYHSLRARKACCRVRKVEQVERALRGAAAWITGLRADQSDGRLALPFVSHDSQRRLLKANPLLDWSRAQLEALVEAENIPVNPLHDRGFLSIGCAPCTRAVAPGEPERAGRWWWEQQGPQECGLHVAPDGRLVRKTTKA